MDGTLLFGAALGWVAVTVVADGLEGAAVLDTLNGNPDASAVRALVAGTLLIYNGSIAFAITGLFLGSAAWATFDSGVLPRWTGWIAVRRAMRSFGYCNVTAVRSTTQASITPAVGDPRSWRTFRP